MSSLWMAKNVRLSNVRSFTSLQKQDGVACSQMIKWRDLRRLLKKSRLGAVLA